MALGHSATSKTSPHPLTNVITHNIVLAGELGASLPSSLKKIRPIFPPRMDPTPKPGVVVVLVFRHAT